MSPAPPPVQRLVSLPPAMAGRFAELEERPRPEWFAAGDSPGGQLGSAGGTAHLLVEAWRADAPGCPFRTWLTASRKLVVHGAGEGRRLPAYAPVGKPLLPVPVLRWAGGQRLTQTLLDLQMPALEAVLEAAPAEYVVLVASGDVLLRFPHGVPPLPAVDVLGFGLWATPETAARHGVFFMPRDRTGELAFFLQKPEPAHIRERAVDHVFAVDTGLWLLSARALELVMRRSGWDAAAPAGVVRPVRPVPRHPSHRAGCGNRGAAGRGGRPAPRGFLSPGHQPADDRGRHRVAAPGPGRNAAGVVGRQTPSGPPPPKRPLPRPAAAGPQPHPLDRKQHHP